MSAGVRAALLALIVLLIGLVAVYLEVECVESGARTRDLLIDEAERRESLRRIDAEVRRLLSPDLLYRDVREEFEAIGAEAVPEPLSAPAPLSAPGRFEEVADAVH